MKLSKSEREVIDSCLWLCKPLPKAAGIGRWTSYQRHKNSIAKLIQAGLIARDHNKDLAVTELFKTQYPDYDNI